MYNKYFNSVFDRRVGLSSLSITRVNFITVLFAKNVNSYYEKMGFHWFAACKAFYTIAQ